MTDAYRTPSFNLKAVVQETGLKPDTLRAWERRYGMPQPGRTEGGHRLYSQYDIDLLKWLAARQDEGLSISRAVKLWNQMEEDGQNPLLTMESPVANSATAVSHLGGDSLDELRETWTKACLNFDERTARQALAQAFAVFSVETVCFELIQKALAEIGNGWYEGRVTVQQEHFASALAIRQMEVLLASAPDPTKNGRILVACPPGEQHTFSPLLFTLLLKRQGWDVVYLGANVPLERLEAAVDTIRPQLVVLVVQTLQAAGNMVDMTNFLVEKQITLAYGGAVFVHIPAVIKYIPGHFLGESIETSTAGISRLLTHPPAVPKPPRPSPAYQEAYNRFLKQRAAIENSVQAHLNEETIPTSYLRIANAQMGDNILAALRLGDIRLLTPDIEWVQGLISHHPFRNMREPLVAYATALHKAVTAELGSSGQIVTGWLEEMLAKAA